MPTTSQLADPDHAELAPRPTVTVIIPAYNEAVGIRDTLESLRKQTVRADRVIVVDDCSTDGTPDVLKEYADICEVLRPPGNLGSKARAQNYALPFCDTTLVLPVDADTVLAPSYIELITKPFDDPKMAIAAGNVQTKYARTVTERGRQIEYLFGFHYYRPIQNAAHSPIVCSGCCSAFRRQPLVDFGGFPERTIVEDFDYTWTQQIAGLRAIYVGRAEAFAADPETPKYLSIQMKRWMSGFFQNVRIHFWAACRHKPMLALWAALAMWEIVTAPLWWATPFLLPIVFHVPVSVTLEWFIGFEVALQAPVIIYAAIRRHQSVPRVLMNIPASYFNKCVNVYHAWRAMIVELVLVPLGKSKGLTTYEKGR